MKARICNVLACLVWAAAIAKSQGAAQAPAPAPPPASDPQPPSPTLAPPREVPSDINTGGGFSLEPIYWMTKSYPRVRQGSGNFHADPGNLDYPTSPDRAVGARASFPIGTNGTLRGSFLQMKSAGATTSPIDLNLFGSLLKKNDLLVVDYKIEVFKLSYDYLTYFWKKKNSEIRLKTLWEIQRISMSNNIQDFVPSADGSEVNVTYAQGTKSVLAPTFGVGIEQTLSRRFRWEARASGFAFPGRSTIGDLEADAAFRAGRFELLVGAKYLHFKTNPKGEQYNSGTIWGPFVGLRFYGKKQPNPTR